MSVEGSCGNKNCDKLISGQRKILKNVRNNLTDILIEYHKMVEEFEKIGIHKEDINISNYFNISKDKQKEFVERYNKEIGKSSKTKKDKIKKGKNKSKLLLFKNDKIDIYDFKENVNYLRFKEENKKLYILYEYILNELNENNELELITNDDIKLIYIPQVIEFIKGNVHQKAIKEQIENLINNTNKFIIHIDGKNKLTDLRKNEEIDKKSDSYKYLISIYKNISKKSKSKTEKTSLQSFHEALTKITLSASDNEDIYRSLVLTILLIISNEKTKQKILNPNTTAEESIKIVKKLIKEDNPELYDMTILTNSKFKNIDLCEILEIAENSIKQDESFVSQLYDKIYDFTNKSNNNKNNVWTPNYISNLMSNLMKPFIKEIYNSIQKDITVLDCACGCNNLFRAMKKTITDIPLKFTGCEIKPGIAKLAELDSKITNLNSNIICSDFFEYTENNPNIIYDVSICNPPYSVKLEENSRPPIDFVLESMNHSKVGCFIFPSKDFDMNNSRLKGKIDILRSFCTIHKIIRFNFTVFSTATIKDIIVVLITNDKYLNCSVSNNNNNVQTDLNDDSSENSSGNENDEINNKLDIQYFELNGKKEDYTTKVVKKGAHEVELNNFGIKVFNEFLKDIDDDSSENSSGNENSEMSEDVEITKNDKNNKNISEVLLKTLWPQDIEKITFEQPNMCNVITRRYSNYFNKIKEIDNINKKNKIKEINELLNKYNKMIDEEIKNNKDIEDSEEDNVNNTSNKIDINEISKFKNIIIDFIKYGTELLSTENSVNRMKIYEYDEPNFINEINKLNNLKNMYFKLENKRFEYVEFLKVFSVVSAKKAKVLPVHDGKYEIISASKYNNGVINYTDDETNELIEGNCYTIGSVGNPCLFYHTEPFYSNGNLLILNPKINLNKINTLLISVQLISFVNDRYMSISSSLKNIKIWIYK